MTTLVMTLMVALFLFVKPPIQALKPHLTEPPVHTPPKAQHVGTLAATLAITSAVTTSTAALLGAAPPAPAITSSAIPTATPSTTPAVALVANPTLAQAQQNQSAREVLYQRVAARSLGEGSFAVPEIACTFKNRLQVSGASLNTVMRAYHARDVRPQPAHIEVVRQVFEGELPCPPTWWYALSLQDTRRWKPHPEPAHVIRRNHRSQIWIFHR